MLTRSDALLLGPFYDEVHGMYHNFYQARARMLTLNFRKIFGSIARAVWHQADSA